MLAFDAEVLPCARWILSVIQNGMVYIFCLFENDMFFLAENLQNTERKHVFFYILGCPEEAVIRTSILGALPG